MNISRKFSRTIINGYAVALYPIYYLFNINYIIFRHAAKSTDSGFSRILVKSYIFTHDRHELLDILNQLVSSITILNIFLPNIRGNYSSAGVCYSVF